jgi:hypothetical protein
MVGESEPPSYTRAGGFAFRRALRAAKTGRYSFLTNSWAVTLRPDLLSTEVTRPSCRSGYTRARISHEPTCLHQGESCVWRYRQQYRRYHFACVRKGKHYRLVRRR